MSEAYLGEIRYFGIGYAPQGWLPCDGRILPVNQYQALYSLLGGYFGGDGRTTFALPDMRGRAGIGEGRYSDQSGTVTYNLGLKSGAEKVALTVASTPQHAHTLNAAKTNATTSAGSGGYLAQPVQSSTTLTPENLYGSGTAVPLNLAAVSTTGGDAGHQNMQPFQAVSFAICADGYYPPRN